MKLAARILAAPADRGGDPDAGDGVVAAAGRMRTKLLIADWRRLRRLRAQCPAAALTALSTAGSQENVSADGVFIQRGGWSFRFGRGVQRLSKAVGAGGAFRAFVRDRGRQALEAPQRRRRDVTRRDRS